jgi:aldose 1-epimerase
MTRGGEEYEIRHGDYTAVITEVGGGFRAVRHGERDLVRPYGPGEVRPRYRGALLAPWPNRVVDGRYSFDGAAYQLSLSEPERHHALHGLVCWSRFELLDSDTSSVVLMHRIVPSTGYPFEVEVVVRYALGEDGFSCSVTAHNVGDARAPYGTASHPYLLGGPGRVDDWTLELPAGRVLEVTEDRLVPTALAPVEGTGFDFRAGRAIGAAELDHAFTGLEPGTDGRVRARELCDGGGVECEWEPGTMPWVQVHTADLPDPAETRRGLALEPMTCPPDAFNSGADLVVLDPGAEHCAEWTLRAV